VEIRSGDETVELPLNAGLLSGIPAFRWLGKELVGLVHDCMTERSFQPGERLMTEGDPGDSLMVVATGEVEVSIEGESGRHVLKRGGAGGIFGEMALLTDEPRSASITALTPVRAWVLPAGRFHELAGQHPRISALLTRLLASRLGKAQHDALTGKTFQGYRILRCLGRGGTSVVYEAEPPGSAPRVALKMMSHRLLYDPAAMERFRREADIVQSFHHPNIAKMFGTFEAFRTFFIVMEFCEGVSIDKVVRRQGPLAETEARKVLGHVCRALHHAHYHGIVHRDIKPSNIMATRDGSVKLVDFGLAGRVEDEVVGDTLWGTPRYMAPEQMGGQGADSRSDLFALGHVAYEMLCGEPLFQGKEYWELHAEVSACSLPDLAQRLPEVSPEFREVLGHLLVRDPGERVLDLNRVASWAAPVDFASLDTGGERSAGPRRAG
jgi:CRP-like cAMP-binding protein